MKRRSFIALLSALPAISIFGWKPFKPSYKLTAGYTENPTYEDNLEPYTAKDPEPITYDKLLELHKLAMNSKIDPFVGSDGKDYYKLMLPCGEIKRI